MKKMKRVEWRTIHGKKVKFIIMIWNCNKCHDSGVVRAPGTSAADAPFKMIDEDHHYLNPECERFEGAVSVPR